MRVRDLSQQHLHVLRDLPQSRETPHLDLFLRTVKCERFRESLSLLSTPAVSLSCGARLREVHGGVKAGCPLLRRLLRGGRGLLYFIVMLLGFAISRKF